MRRKLLATSLALVALTAFAPTAGAEEAVEVEDRDYICIRSRPLLGDRSICIKFTGDPS
jgi:hypothetical protein